MSEQGRSFTGAKGWGLGLLLVLIMANLSALIDSVEHPEIPYFNTEHMLVGGITALVTAFFYLLLMKYVANLKKKEQQIQLLNEELEAKIVERTRQLRDAQEELVRKEKLFIIGELSSSVGHELRNPLGVMSNAVFFLKMVHAEADTTTKEYLEIIKQEIDTSLRIITDLLDFAQIRPPQQQPVNVAELVRKSLGTCTIPGNVTVSVVMPAEVPTLHVDPTQMEQVLANCITNAVQAMPEGGTLRVAAESRSTDGANNFVEIAITDSGEGIAPENIGNLFQPLFSTRINGLGLGLVVCKNLVEANGGTIKAESEPGKGATFTVLLPLEKDKR